MSNVRLFLIVLMSTACTGGDIRGKSTTSADGGTYLTIADDNGGKCGPLLVDGKVWLHPIDRPGKVQPGRHVIACGGEIPVQIDSGQTYRFDYWGP